MRKIVVTASGGGHTGYAVTILRELLKHVPEEEVVVVIPRGDTWTRSRVEALSPRLRIIEVLKPRHPREPLRMGPLLKALSESLGVIPRGCVLVSSGSNHSVPPALSAKIKGGRVVNIESSVRMAQPSASFSWLQRISDLDVVQWPEQAKLCRNRRKCFVLPGPLYEEPPINPFDGGYLLVACGTYGYPELVKAFVDSWSSIRSLGIEKMIIQIGREGPEPEEIAGDGIEAFRYSVDLPKIIAGARIVVTHLGKTAIDAALGAHKPVIIAPNPRWFGYSAGIEDAKLVASKIGAVLIEPPPTPDKVLEAVSQALKASPPRIPCGAPELVRKVLDLAHS